MNAFCESKKDSSSEAVYALLDAETFDSTPNPGTTGAEAYSATLKFSKNVLRAPDSKVATSHSQGDSEFEALRASSTRAASAARVFSSSESPSRPRREFRAERASDPPPLPPPPGPPRDAPRRLPDPPRPPNPRISAMESAKPTPRPRALLRAAAAASFARASSESAVFASTPGPATSAWPTRARGERSAPSRRRSAYARTRRDAPSARGFNPRRARDSVCAA